MTQTGPVQFHLSDPDETAAAGEQLAPYLKAGDCILLSGDIGAGKTHFARALIQHRLNAAGRLEDVPSPTYTLVQTYTDGETEIWHADLYRLNSTGDVEELGLFEAMDTAIVLIEWPNRLGEDAPPSALSLHFAVDGAGRRLTASGPARLVSALRVAS